MDTSKTNVPDKTAEGRIMRIKQGYNPNSSSMGSMIFILPASLLAVTAGFGVISGIIMSAVLRPHAEHAPDTAKTPAKEEKL